MLGTLNALALLSAVGSFMVDFAILAPAQLYFDIGNVESVKAAIFQAQSQGIEMMRRSAFAGGAGLSVVMILNFVVLCCFATRGSRKINADRE